MRACSLEHLAEQILEELPGRTFGVEPLSRKQLATGALVLAARLEPGEEPPVDVVRGHLNRCRPERACT